MTELTASMVTDMVHVTIPAIGRLGIVVERIARGDVQLRAPLEGNANHVGTMYAGTLFALAELPGGLLPLTVLDPDAYTPIVTDMALRYLAPARTDVSLTARLDPAELLSLASRADAEGRAGFTLELEGVDDAGRTVIASRGEYQLRRSSRSAAPPS